MNTKPNKTSFAAGNVPWNKRHGMAGRPRPAIYRSWEAMKRRCLSKTSDHSKWYQERGITVCERWLKFDNFLSDMGPMPTGRTLERIDNDKGYSPENCRWATQFEQGQNNRNNRLLVFDGKTLSIAEWARTLNMSQYLIAGRLNRHGWSVEKTLSTPPRKFTRHG